MLSQAVEDTEFVWVTSLNQTNTTFSLNGTGTSIQAVEAFISNLEDTGYFRNINLGPLQEAGPNYTFQLAMSFLPPLLPGETAAGAAGPGTVR
jgi:Tfp pilus assembly protein PilN